MDRRARTQAKTSGSSPGRKRLIVVLSIVGGLLLLTGLAVGGSVLYARGLVRRLTSTQPDSLPVTQLGRDEQRKVERNLQRFVTACQKGQAEQIEFNDHELNGVLGALEECRGMRGKVALEIVDGQPWVQASIPLSDTGVSWLQGRYLNGKFRLNVQLKESGLSITVADVVVPGGQVPDWVLKRLRAQDFGQEAYRDRTWGPRLRRLESLDFNQDKLVVQTKKGS